MRLDHDVAFPPPAVVEIVGIGGGQGGQCNHLQSFSPIRLLEKETNSRAVARKAKAA
jgi:hypothetical protein